MAMRFFNVVFTAALILPAALIVFFRRRRNDQLLGSFNFAEAKARER